MLLSSSSSSSSLVLLLILLNIVDSKNIGPMPKRYAVSTEKGIYNEIQSPKVTFLLDIKKAGSKLYRRHHIMTTIDVGHDRMHQTNKGR